MATLTKKQKEVTYPKTYWESCEVLGCYSYNIGFDRCKSSTEEVLHDVLLAFRELYICRNAYLKLYSEENGLEKPWEPDWTNYNEYKFVIGVNENKIIKRYNTIAQFVLAFPTEEMRDTFYDNFKELIEQCKDLL
jgi:hypothetical protein